MTVQAAADEVRRRSLSDVGALWREVELRRVWGDAVSAQSIRDRLESTLSYDQVTKTGILEDEDLRQIALLELLAISAKAAHLTRALDRMHSAGHYTISAFNAFHGSLFCAKALMASF